MPPGWIEHPTSPLPRARSTTELRRRVMAGNMAYWPQCGNNGGAAMSEARVSDHKGNKKRPAVTPARAEEQDERKKRLAAALRENLRKRKSQKRAQTEGGGGGD